MAKMNDFAYMIMSANALTDTFYTLTDSRYFSFAADPRWARIAQQLSLIPNALQRGLLVGNVRRWRRIFAYSLFSVYRHTAIYCGC